MQSILERQKCLVLFSGGKDSFLSTCRLIMTGYDVELFFCNNGAVQGEERILDSVQRLQDRFGSDRIVYAGAYNTSALVLSLTTTWAYDTWRELGEKYPTLVNAQTVCLHCQAAMWAAAIGYAKAQHIDLIATGYKSCDAFCTGVPEWNALMEGVATKLGVYVLRPVWDEGTNWGRNAEMEMLSLAPITQEPKCMLGRPVKRMSALEESDMLRYCQDNLVNKVSTLVTELASTFKSLRLSSKSLV